MKRNLDTKLSELIIHIIIQVKNGKIQVAEIEQYKLLDEQNKICYTTMILNK